MYGETALGIVDKAEVLACLLNRDHVHKAGWIGGVRADFTIDLDETLHDNGFGLAAIESILETR